MGVRSKNHYLGYVFGSLWFVGLVCAISLVGVFARNFKTKSGVEETVNITQPWQNKMFVDVARNDVRYYGDDWFGIEWDDDMPFYGINPDTLMMNTVRVNVVKSKDSLYHVYKIRFSRGNTPQVAKDLATKINFNITQKDSTILLPKGFAISKNEKFRNQQVLVVIEVPVGKKIQLDNSVTDYDWFTVNFNRRRGINVDWEDNWDYTYGWRSNVEYIMTADGLERSDRVDDRENRDNRLRRNNNGGNDIEIKRNDNEKKRVDTVYRYHGNRKVDTATTKIKDVNISYTRPVEKRNPSVASAELNTPFAVFTRLLL